MTIQIINPPISKILLKLDPLILRFILLLNSKSKGHRFISLYMIYIADYQQKYNIQNNKSITYPLSLIYNSIYPIHKLLFLYNHWRETSSANKGSLIKGVVSLYYTSTTQQIAIEKEANRTIQKISKEGKNSNCYNNLKSCIARNQ